MIAAEQVMDVISCCRPRLTHGTSTCSHSVCAPLMQRGKGTAALRLELGGQDMTCQDKKSTQARSQCGKLNCGGKCTRCGLKTGPLALFETFINILYINWSVS
jgi:hypothetical protein